MSPNVFAFPQSRPGAWLKAMWPLAAGLLLLTVTMSPGRLLSWDASIRLATTRALWSQGTVFVEMDHPQAAGMVEVNGQFTSFYGIGQSLLLIPFDIAGATLRAVVDPVDEKQAQLLEWAPLLFVYAPLMALALWASLSWLLHELGVRGGASGWSAALYCVTTISFAYSAQSLQEETLIATLIACAAAGILHCGRTKSPAGALLAGFCAAFALLCRLNALFALLPLAVLLYERGNGRNDLRLERLKFFAVGTILPLALHFLFAYWRFGNAFSTGYDILADNGMGNSFGLPRPALALGMLFGFGKGVLVLSPPLLLAAFGWKELSKNRPELWVSVVIALVLSALFHSSLALNPDGSECWGVRYLVHSLVWLAFPMRLGVQHLATVGWGRAVATCVLVAGFWIQLAACFAPDSIEYIDAASDGLSQDTLVWGLGDGQLGRRVANIGRWLENNPSTDPKTEAIWASYVPNVWGTTYHKKSGYPGFLLLWGLTALLSAGLWAWWLGSSTRNDGPALKRSNSERRRPARAAAKRGR